MEYEGHEMDTPETRKTEKLQFMCRRRADVGSFRMPSPPSNDEVEVLGIEVRMPNKHNGAPDVTFENTNLNNYSVLVRYKQDEGSVGFHMPYVISMRYINDCAASFSEKSYKMIGEYAKAYYKAIRSYNGDYWKLRYSHMNTLSNRSRKQNQQYII
jgi:hypothetical protein